MNKKNLFLYAIAICCMAIFLGSCDETLSSETPTDETTELRLGVDRIRTRALDEEFEKLDRIGLYAVKWKNGESTTLQPAGNYADNTGFTLQDENDNWQADTHIYFPADGEKLDLYAYYPYADLVTEAGTTTVDFRIRPDQRIYADYTASDFVTADRKGVNRTTDKVNLTFDHKLSQLLFSLKASEGFTAEELATATITIKNAIITARYDLSERNSGIPVAGTERSDVLPTGTWQASENDDSVLYGYKGIIVPQELNEETYFEITLGSRLFVQKFPAPITMKSGESRLFTITMKNTGLEISTTLNPWNYGDPVEGEAEEPEEPKFDPASFVAIFEIPADDKRTSISFSPRSMIEGKENFKYDCIIDWGDGSEPDHVYEEGYKDHTYLKEGTYYITVTGSADYISLMANKKLTTIVQWGDLGVKTWYESMNNCKKLTSIPTGMPDSESFYGTFYYTGLQSIPAGLFSKCVSAKNFDYTFANCWEIETIGEGVFDNCISAETFDRTFTEGFILKEIPVDLFKDCINATIFDGTFLACRQIKSIPEGLFDACTNVTSFNSTFLNCGSLTSCPVSLFDHNIKVTDFAVTFAGCTSLTEVTPNTNGIELWMRSFPEYPQYPDEINIQGCFGGCTKLSNYNDIPEGAK